MRSHQTAAIEQVRTLGKALAYAKLSRAETEQHIRVVEEYLRDGKSIGMMVTKLPEGRIREFLKGVSEHQQNETELNQHREMKSELTGIYGKNHPRIKELDGKIELLSSRQETGSPSLADGSKGDLSEPGLLLQSVQGFVEQGRTYEEELQHQLERAQMTVDSGDRVDRELESITQRISLSQKREAEIQKRLSELDVHPTIAPITIVQLPWLLPSPVSIHLQTVLLISLGPGFLLGILLNSFLHHRRRVRQGSKPGTIPKLPSLQERRLMRNRNLNNSH